jgi:acyl carrier protein
MGLDSVELVMAFEEEFGISISDEAAAHMQTPADAIAWISQRVNALPDGSPCFSIVEFHRVREEQFTMHGIPRRAVKLQSLLPNGWFASLTVRDEVRRRVRKRANALRKRRKLDPRWKRSEVREAVREIVREQIGVEEFSDKDHFIRDLGVD